MKWTLLFLALLVSASGALAASYTHTSELRIEAVASKLKDRKIGPIEHARRQYRDYVAAHPGQLSSLSKRIFYLASVFLGLGFLGMVLFSETNYYSEPLFFASVVGFFAGIGLYLVGCVVWFGEKVGSLFTKKSKPSDQ
ncbi:MAG: hypothetical protein OHK0039_38300 [Bacteroidia bacterium]